MSCSLPPRKVAKTLLKSDNTAYWLGCLSNHDIRQVLAVSRDLINSPHLGFDDAFKAYVTASVMDISENKIRRGMIRGRYDIYRADSHKFVHNIFDLNAEIPTSPLLALRILQVTKDAAIHHGETKSAYISKTDLVAYMCGMGFERRVIALWIDALLKRALLFNYDPTCVDEPNATQLEISPSGELHPFWGCGGYDYLFAMAETTPVRDEAAFTEMQLAYRDRPQNQFYGVMAHFLRYLVTEDQLFCRIPNHESYRGQIALFRKIDATARKFECRGWSKTGHKCWSKTGQAYRWGEDFRFWRPAAARSVAPGRGGAPKSDAQWVSRRFPTEPGLASSR